MYCTLSSILNIPSLVSYIYLSILINRSHAPAPRPPCIPLPSWNLSLSKDFFQITHMPFPTHTQIPPPPSPLMYLLSIWCSHTNFENPSLFQPLCLCFKVPNINSHYIALNCRRWLVDFRREGERGEEGGGKRKGPSPPQPLSRCREGKRRKEEEEEGRKEGSCVIFLVKKRDRSSCFGKKKKKKTSIFLL